MTQATYTVSGMTCDHCVRSVQAEVGKIAGVIDVGVDLAQNQVTVTSEAPLDVEVVREAVDEAGFELQP